MAGKSGAGRGVFAANTRTVASRVGDLVILKHDRFIGDSLRRYGEWAQAEIDRLLAYVNPGDFVIDIGANVGYHALSFARRVGRSGTVWAFEPDPVNGLVLRLNIVNSGLDAVVIPFDAAVSSQSGTCAFRSYPISMPENFGHAAVDAAQGEYPRISLSLDMLTLDRAPALVKIDIEGHELPALEGMTDLLDRHGPVLSIEADAEDDANAIAAFVSEYGYDTYDFVTNAFNADNFAGNADDVWLGHGRCANVLCVRPGVHAIPDALPLRRKAAAGGRELHRLGRRAAQAQVPASMVPAGGDGLHSAMADMQDSLRADIRGFVGGFLRSMYGELDPVRFRELIDSALAYLSAARPADEGRALRSFLLAAVDGFSNAVAGTNRAAGLERDLAAAGETIAGLSAQTEALDAELAAARGQLAEAACAVDALRQDRAAEQIQADEQAAVIEADMMRLNAALSQASVAAAQMQSELAEERAELAEERARAAADEARCRRLQDEVAALAAEVEAGRIALEAKEEANAAVKEWAARHAELTDRLAAGETQLAMLHAELDGAQHRLAAQALEIRRLRAVS